MTAPSRARRPVSRLERIAGNALTLLALVAAGVYLALTL